MPEVGSDIRIPSPAENGSIGHVELRSEGVQEVLGRIPPWTIRYGITVIFGLILLLLLLAWLIRYPDVIVAKGVLTSLDPPREVPARAEGRLMALKVTDGAEVAQGEVLAVIESAAQPAAIESLRRVLPLLHGLLTSERDSLPDLHDLELGEGQRSWADARALASELLRWRTDPYREQRYASLRQKIALFKRLIQTAEQQLVWARRKQTNAIAEARVDTTLLNKGVMAASEYRMRQNAFIDQQLNVGSLEASLHQQRITLVELESQLADQLFTDESKQRELEQRLRSELNGLQAFLDSWHLNNEVTAPCAGRLHYAQRLNTDEPVKNAELLFRVLPTNPTYLVEATAPVRGAAKVREGQAAYMRLDGYPADEFGRLIGTVEHVALIPGEEGYRLRIALPQGLKTSFHRTLAFKPEMNGQVDVVTRDRSILGRIVDRLRGAMDR
jgi:multidrug efflux pump subunit AcrA (membrane-fusion protein)